VVINDFDPLWPGVRTEKAEPELVVDADAVLAMAVSAERLQAIAWWDLQIIETAGGIEDGERFAIHDRDRLGLVGDALQPVALRPAPAAGGQDPLQGPLHPDLHPEPGRHLLGQQLRQEAQAKQLLVVAAEVEEVGAHR
jgi:hypothetical protein